MHCQYGITPSRKACAQQAKTLQAHRAPEEEDVSPTSAQSLQGRFRRIPGEEGEQQGSQWEWGWRDRPGSLDYRRGSELVLREQHHPPLYLQPVPQHQRPPLDPQVRGQVAELWAPHLRLQAHLLHSTRPPQTQRTAPPSLPQKVHIGNLRSAAPRCEGVYH